MAQADGVRNPLAQYWPVLGGPVTSAVLIAGLAIVVIAAALNTGVWAGILGIIGILLVLIAVVSRAAIVLYERL